MKLESTGNNIFHISLNGVAVGSSATEDVDDYVRRARLQIAGERDSLVMVDAQVEVQGEEVWFGKVDSD